MKTLISAALAALLAVGAVSGVSAAGDRGGSGGGAQPVAQQASADIVDTAVANGSFRTLATALQAAGLVETLKGPGPFTVFAPTDAAFAALPAGTVDALLKDQTRLQEVLLYHVVPGQVLAADVTKMSSAATVQGSSLPIATQGSSVRVGSANVTAADVRASNGVIHVIDAVLLPPSATQASGQAARTQVPSAPNTGNAGALDSATGYGWIAAGLLLAAIVVGGTRYATTHAPWRN
jgi:uncharacterized surface protein with fasciclin (FAS1) repeats